MNEQQHIPTQQQTKYLGYLLSRAHTLGMPHLPIDALSKAQVSAWIDYLKPIVDKEEEPKGSSSYFITPGRNDLPAYYRPPYDLVTAAFDHEHRLDCYLTADDYEIVYCTLCGGEW